MPPKTRPAKTARKRPAPVPSATDARPVAEGTSPLFELAFKVRPGLSGALLAADLAVQTQPVADLASEDRALAEQAYKAANGLITLARILEEGHGGENMPTAGGRDSGFACRDLLARDLAALRAAVPPALVQASVYDLAAGLYAALAGIYARGKKTGGECRRRAGRAWSTQRKATEARLVAAMLWDTGLTALRLGLHDARFDAKRQEWCADILRGMLAGESMPSETARTVARRMLRWAGLSVAEDTVREHAREVLRAQGVSPGDLRFSGFAPFGRPQP